MARKRRKSGSTEGSRKRPAEETSQGRISPCPIRIRLPATPNSGSRQLSLRSSPPRALVFTCATAARSSRRVSSAATFVGSETCAGCHQARSKTVGRLAAQGRDGARDRQDRAWRFQRRQLRLLRRAFPLLPQGRKIPGRDRRSRRQACHLRGEVHFWRRSAAAISRRIPRRTPAGAGAFLGQPAEGSRAASAGFMSIRTRRSSTTMCCTGPN